MTQSGSRWNYTVTVQQVRAARGLLGWSQTELAKRAGLSRETVKRFEAPTDLNVSSEARAKLQQALENAVPVLSGPFPLLAIALERFVLLRPSDAHGWVEDARGRNGFCEMPNPQCGGDRPASFRQTCSVTLFDATMLPVFPKARAGS